MGAEGCGKSAFEGDVVMKGLTISAVPAALIVIQACLILMFEKYPISVLVGRMRELC